MFFQMLPCGAAIVGAIHTAARTSTSHAPGRTPSLPQSCKENIGVMRIEGHVDATGVFVLVEHLLPGLATVGSAENATFRVWPEGMAQSRDKRDVRIVGIDDDLPDRARVAQTDVLPCLATVESLVNSIAVRNIAANAGLARAHVQHIVV